MEEKKLSVVWSNRALNNLESIYNYYLPKSEQGANRIKEEILKATSNLHFTKQYQVDEVNDSYRRIVVRHYKILYRIKGNQIRIASIFDSRQDPSKMKR